MASIESQSKLLSHMSEHISQVENTIRILKGNGSTKDAVEYTEAILKTARAKYTAAADALIRAQAAEKN